MTPTLRLSKLLIVLLLLLTSCQKDDGTSNDGNQNENIPDTFSNGEYPLQLAIKPQKQM